MERVCGGKAPKQGRRRPDDSGAGSTGSELGAGC